MAKDKDKDAEVQGTQGAEASALRGKIGELREFLDEAKVELKKVTWPARKEVIATCSAVMILVAVMSLFLGVVDLGLTKIVQAILS